jgi:hypothetical protein
MRSFVFAERKSTLALPLVSAPKNPTHRGGEDRERKMKFPRSKGWKRELAAAPQGNEVIPHVYTTRWLAGWLRRDGTQCMDTTRSSLGEKITSQPHAPERKCNRGETVAVRGMHNSAQRHSTLCKRPLRTPLNAWNFLITCCYKLALTLVKLNLKCLKKQNHVFQSNLNWYFLSEKLCCACFSANILLDVDFVGTFVILVAKKLKSGAK